ncbi:MAG: glutaredoxin family protein [Candidatus Ratteibacteria bacterium]
MVEKVILYGKEDCGLCMGWKKKLENFNIPFDFIDVADAANLADFTYEGFTKIPALIIGKKRFDGPKPSEITVEQIHTYLRNE